MAKVAGRRARAGGRTDVAEEAPGDGAAGREREPQDAAAARRRGRGGGATTRLGGSPVGGVATSRSAGPATRPPARTAVRGDLTADFLTAAVAAVFRLPVGDIGAATRRAPVALARQVGIYVAHVGLALTLTEAGRLFGRDRTTAAHACRRIEDGRDDPRFDGLVAALEALAAAWRASVPSEGAAPVGPGARTRREARR